MAIIAKVSTVKNLNVKFNSDSGILSPTSSGITLGNFTAGVNRLDQLVDVIEAQNGNLPANGSTLIYNSTEDKYFVQTLTSLNSNNITDLDGGSF